MKIGENSKCRQSAPIDTILRLDDHRVSWPSNLDRLAAEKSIFSKVEILSVFPYRGSGPKMAENSKSRQSAPIDTIWGLDGQGQLAIESGLLGGRNKQLFKS